MFNNAFHKMELPKDGIQYYDDELTDDFTTVEATDREIGDDYKYEPVTLKDKIIFFIVYRLIVNPFAAIFLKIFFSHKIINRKALWEHRDKGYFVYINHTQPRGDAFIPMKIMFPKKAFIVCHQKLVFMTFWGFINRNIGAMPLPGTPASTKNFMRAMEHHIDDKAAVVIYPEAKVWPFYTGVRPFPDNSFRYPVQLNAPVFCFTNVYKKKLFRRIPRIETYIDGPFYPSDPNASRAAQKKDLRTQVYSCMVERSKLSTVNYVKYIKRGSPEAIELEKEKAKNNPSAGSKAD